MALKRQLAEKDSEHSTKNNKNSTRNLSMNLSSVTEQKNVEKKAANARVIIKYDVGFRNSLYVRGKGANLSWDKGVPLKNIKADEWIWEPEAPFSQCEFKVLINDSCYEAGENHHLNPGMKIQYTPKF